MSIRTQQRRRAAGVTLLEVMVVVAIVGILSAIAAGGMRSLVTTTRVAQSGRVLATAFRQTRLRSMATHCTHFVQVNGPTYGGSGANAVGPAGFLGVRNQAAIYRKGDCTSTQAGFAPGDILVDSFVINDAPIGSLDFVVPAPLIASTTLDNNAFGVAYDGQGSRTVWVDEAGGGAASFVDVTATVPAILSLTIRSHSAQVDEAFGTLSIPLTGGARFP